MAVARFSESFAFTMRALASILKPRSPTSLPTLSWCRSSLLRWIFLRFGEVFLLASLMEPGEFRIRVCMDGHEGLFLLCDGSITLFPAVEESQSSIAA